jgi:RNA polymerase sigma factor (sigma-70 family)
MSEVTRILCAIEQGDPQAAEQLLPLVYQELRRLAAQKMAHEAPGLTLQATALVHEAYLRLVASGGRESPDNLVASGGRKSPDNPQHWNSRGHFFAAAAEAMRRILIEDARRKKAEKHGGDRQRVELAEGLFASNSTAEELLILDDALSSLSREDPAAAEVAKLRLFAGLSVEQAAQTIGVSRATAFRHWTYARAWLHAELRDSQDA